MSEMFREFPKMARLNRECVITEKIDGTNAAVRIIDQAEYDLFLAEGGNPNLCIASMTRLDGTQMYLFAQSRTRNIIPGDDNYGFAKWVSDNAEELFKLGHGFHYGEWWGSGIQRGYGLTKGDKRFSLFNVSRWADDSVRPACCGVVPELYRGAFDTFVVQDIIRRLREGGSVASPGFMKPEGVVVFHTAANMMFKVTCDKDDVPKSKVKGS